LKGKDHLGDLGIDGRIILKWILNNRVRGHGFKSSSSGQGLVADSCEHDNEPLSSVKGI
jgi:hypothetical protein